MARLTGRIEPDFLDADIGLVCPGGAETQLAQADADARDGVDGLAYMGHPARTLVEEGQRDGEADDAAGITEQFTIAPPHRAEGGIAVRIQHPAELFEWIGRGLEGQAAGDDIELIVEQQQMLARMQDEMPEGQQRIEFRAADQPTNSLDIVRAGQVASAFPAADLALRHAQAFGDGILTKPRPNAPGTQLAADFLGHVVLLLEHAGQNRGCAKKNIVNQILTRPFSCVNGQFQPAGLRGMT